jgi:hypothetical protein
MVVSPAVRGLFGIEADALHRTLRLQPQLPASWDFAEIRNVRVGDDLYAIALKRDHDHLLATVSSAQPSVLCLNSQNETCHDRSTATRTAVLPLPSIEVSLAQQQLPEAGSRTSQPRIIDESYKDQDLSLTVEGVAGTTVDLFLRTNRLSPSNKRATDIKVEGAERFGGKLQVNFPQGSGFVTQNVHISWPK